MSLPAGFGLETFIGSLVPPEYRLDLQEILRQPLSNRNVYVIATAPRPDGRPIGVLVVVREGGKSQIGPVLVRKNYQGMGVGRALRDRAASFLG